MTEAGTADAHGRLSVREGKTVEVFRAVHVSDPNDPWLWESFRSDAELGEDRMDRDDIDYQAVSCRERFDQVRDLIRNIARKEGLPPHSAELEIGNYVARVVLRAEHDALFKRDPPPRGHVSIWGDARQLATAVAEVQSAWA